MSEGPGGLPALSVAGGAGGVHARFDDLERLGRLVDDTGGRLSGWAWDDKLAAADGDLLASAVLAPRTFAAAEAAVLEATVGPRGLAARAVVLEAESLSFGACAELYRAADETQRVALEALHYGLGWVAGRHLPEVLLVGAAAYAGLRLAGVDGADAVGWLEDHPAVLETAVGSGGGLLDGLGSDPLAGPVMAGLGLGGFHPDSGAAAADLGDLLFGSWTGGLAPGHPTDDFALAPPHDVGDLVGGLGQVAGEDVPDGVFAVQTLTGPGGEVRHVVHLPGTDDFLAEEVVRGTGSNLQIEGHEHTAYADAIAQALQQAGVGPDEPLLLVGHSQGGMQAAALAADPDFPYAVSHVVTAGSPVANHDVPDDVAVLSLENSGDVVPLLDGGANPSADHHTTVQADVHSGSLGAGPGQNHSLDVYGQIAAAVDSSDDPGLQQSVASLQAAGFLVAPDGGVASSTLSFQAVLGEQVAPPGLPGWQQLLP